VKNGFVEGLRWMRVSGVPRAWVVVDGAQHLLLDDGGESPCRLGAVGVSDGGAWWCIHLSVVPLFERAGSAGSLEEAREVVEKRLDALVRLS
jgi:hypothetical protein